MDTGWSQRYPKYEHTGFSNLLYPVRIAPSIQEGADGMGKEVMTEVAKP